MMRLIEPFGAGGGPDIVARILALPLSERLGRPVEVLNHPGRGSTAAPALVHKSPADGESLLINTSAHAYSAAAIPRLPYDPLADFVAVARLTSQAYVVVAGTTRAVTTLADLVAAATTTPGVLRFASTGIGTGTHIGMEELNHRLEIDVVHRPAAPSEAISDIVTKVVVGGADYAMLPITIAERPIAAGNLVALGVTTAQRCPALPGVRTLAEAGATDYDFPIWYGTWAAAATPNTIVETLTGAIADALAEPHVRAALAAHGMESQCMIGPEFARFVADEARRAADVLAR